MGEGQATRYGAARWFPFRATPAFVCLFLFLWHVIDTSLVYYGYWLLVPFPVFRADWGFVRDFLTYPGGPVEGLSAFLSQLFAWPWLGALILTAVTAALSATTWWLAIKSTRRAPRFLHLLPAVVLAVCYARYVHGLTWALGACVAMAAAGAYAWLPARRGPARLAVFAVLAACTWYVAGGAVVLLAAACALHELIARRAAAPALACAALGILLPLAASRWVLPMQWTGAFLRATPGYDLRQFRPPRDFPVDSLWLRFAMLLLWLPLVVPLLVAPLRRRAARPEDAGARASLIGRWLRGETPWAVDAVLAALGLLAILGVMLDVPTRSRFRVEKCGRSGDWRGLLAAAASLPREEYGFVVNWEVNRALYHRGELPDRMFEFRQHPLGLFPSARYVPGMQLPYSCWMKLGDVMMELGRVNDAEHMAYESMENLGDQPHMLRRLVMVYAAKDRPETARVVLSALSADLRQGRWARGFTRRLREAPAFTWHAPTARTREMMPAEDRVGWVEPVDMLNDLLERNGANRMAFEYLMGELLLRRELDALIGNLGRLRQLGFARLPRCYEEAIVLRQGTTGMAAETAGWTVSPETYARYRQFLGIVNSYAGNREAARAAAAPQFGRSYFYYYTFGRSGDTQ